MSIQARERYKVVHPFAAGQDPDLVSLEDESWIADGKLARDGGRRVSDWTWETVPEEPWRFSSRVAELRSRIGQPWDSDDPDDLITAEDVAEVQAKGPEHYRIGSCWAVRA